MNTLRMSDGAYAAHQKRIKCGIAGVVADLKAPITNKFGATKTTIDGIEFDSKHEAQRYLLLRDMQRHGEIKELKCQVPIQMKVNGVHIGTYIADFSYVTPEGKRWEDAKGYRKGSAYQLFKLKAAIVLTMGINVEEV